MTESLDDPRIAALHASWRRMDASAAAETLRSTTWSYLTGATDPPHEPPEPMQEWDAATAASQRTEELASVVVWNVLSHDPRFAEQLKRLWRGPSARTCERLARATAALMGVELLPDPRD